MAAGKEGLNVGDYKLGLIIIAVVLVLVALVRPQPPTLVQQGQSSLAGENYSIDGQNVSVTRQYYSSSDKVTYSNEGSKKVDFGVVDVIPPSLAEKSDEVLFSNSGSGAAKTTFFDNKEPPVLRLTTITLYPGQDVARETNSKKIFLFQTIPKPIHLFSPAFLNDSEKKVLEPALKKASALLDGLSDEEAKVFEKKLNDGILKAKGGNATFVQTAQFLSNFIDQVKKAKDESSSGSNALATPTETASPTGKPASSASPRATTTLSPTAAAASAAAAPESFLDRLKKMSMNVTKPTPAPTPSVKIDLPKLPDEITLEVSESNPADSKEIFIASQGDFGAALLKISGDAGDYTTVSSEKVEGGYSFKIDVYVDAELQNGIWPFDSVEGTLEVAFSQEVSEVKSAPIKIIVKHDSVETVLDTQIEPVDTQQESIPQAPEKPAPSFTPSGYATPSGSGYVWPVVGKFSCCSPFGAPRVGHTHQGIDIFAAIGVPIVAPASGIVKKVVRTDKGTCGLQVSLLLDDGTWVTNCHLSKVDAYVGQRVKACTKIGEVGKTGNAKTTPPHLHIQFGRPNWNWIDPLKQSNNVLYSAKANKRYCNT